jgi:hypothetical protein
MKDKANYVEYFSHFPLLCNSLYSIPGYITWNETLQAELNEM